VLLVFAVANKTTLHEEWGDKWVADSGPFLMSVIIILSSY